MGREANKLTNLEIRKLTKPGRYADGHGLYLQISANGGKSWLFRFMQHGTAHNMGLGPLHTLSLSEARARARDARQLLLDGKSPLADKRDRKLAMRLERAKQMTFEEAVSEFLKSPKVAELRNPKHRKQWESTLKRATMRRSATS